MGNKKTWVLQSKNRAHRVSEIGWLVVKGWLGGQNDGVAKDVLM